MCYGITVPKAEKKPSFEGLPNPETVKNGCGSGSRTCYFEKMNLNRKNYILGPINRGSLFLGGSLETFIYITVSTKHDDDNNPMQRKRSL